MILRMIYDWYKENSEYTAIYDINDLWAVHLDRKGSLSKFKNEWDATLLRLKTKPSEVDILQPLFYKHLKKVDAFAFDIATYDRLPDGHVEKTDKGIVHNARPLHRAQTRRAES